MSKPGWKTAMVVFHDTPAAADPDLAIQERASSAQREQLVTHLAAAGASAEVALPPASPLPSLLVEGSPLGLEEVLRAPSVKEVLEISGDIEMEAL